MEDIDAVECFKIIDELREEEGSAVAICSDNPDFNGMPNCQIEITASWTDWEPAYYRADTVLDCLKIAQKVKQQLCDKG